MTENIAINTLITDQGFAIVFSWPRKFEKCTTFIKSLANVDYEMLPSTVVELLFSYIENTYFSKAWLASLSDDKKLEIESKARRSIQYGYPVRFTGKEYTNWKVDRIELI